MKTFDLISCVVVFEDDYELPAEWASLLKQAREAARNAYTPYSNFKVGAALQLNNGVIITGNNQENAAFPSGLCAERTACFYASSQYPDTPFSRIAITAINPKEKLTKPISPCGSCRQSLLEYEQKFGQNIEVLLAGEEGEIYLFKSIEDLLPFSFSSNYLP